MTNKKPTARTKERAMMVFRPAVGIVMGVLCWQEDKSSVARLGRRRPEPRPRGGGFVFE